MASRILYGSRVPKPRTRAEDSAEKPSAIPKRSSISAVPATVSKPPTHTSLLSKPKTRKPEERTIPAPKSTAQRPTPTERRPSDASLQRTDVSNASSGIPRGIDTGMGVRTEISVATPAPRNRLRRKPSSQDQRSRYARSETSKSSNDVIQRPAENESTSSIQAYNDPFPGSVFGISLPPVSSTLPALSGISSLPTEYATSNSRMASYIPKQPSPFSANDLTPPTPNFAAQSSSASTRCSESPGPFSRTSTPTSVSSHSPGIVQAPKSVTRPRPSVSPTRSRPPVTRRKIGGTQIEENETQGLSALRESVTSSSSSSTVKTSEPSDRAYRKQPTRMPRLQAPAPTPPLRLSSKRSESRPAGKELVKEEQAQGSQGRLPRPSQIPGSQSQPQSKLPTSSNDRIKLPPPRPSREGIPVLQSFRPTVVQSNLSHLATTGHKRRESAEKALLPSPPKGEEKLGRLRSPSLPTPSSRKPLQTPPADLANVAIPHLSKREPSRSREPMKTPNESRAKLSKREPSPMDTSPAKSASRFGLFTRKLKSHNEGNVNPSEKPTKKGPVAGTGHEGYGKYARRGRSSSTSTVASRTSTERTSFSVARPSSSRKSSFASSDGKPELDDFFRDRLEPVVIGGGGKIRENRNSGGLGLYQTQSGQSSISSLDKKPTQSRMGQTAIPHKSFMASPPPVSRELLPAPRIEPQISSEFPNDARSLAHRRSENRSQLFGEAEPVRIPPPINTKVLAPSPMLDTYDSTLSTVPQTASSLVMSDDLSEGHEGNWLRSKKKTQEKPKLTRKWNFFHRQHRSPERPSVERQDSYDSARELPVAVANVREPRTIAHYAMLDQFEHESEENLEEILRNIENNLTVESDEQTTSLAPPKREREPSMLLPSPPRFPAVFESPRPASPKVQLNQTNAVPSQQPAKRVPRLQQVGRIPKVVSKRDRPHNPSPQSFSRPFTARPSLDEEHPGLFAVPEQAVTVAQTAPLPSLPWMEHYYNLGHGSQDNNVLQKITAEPEFLVFSRKGSEVSGSSSSGVLSLAPITAITPLPEDILSEDEVWDEYDELLDHVTSPLSYEPVSPLVTDYFGNYPSQNNVKPRVPHLTQDSHLVSDASSDATARAITPRANRPPALPARPDFLELPSPHNNTPSACTLSDLYSNYANRSSAAKSSVRHSMSSTISGSRYSSQTVFSRGSRSSTDSSHTKRVTQVMAEKTNNLSTDSLRFSALMTSRWLSFDRVLFSPVQDELRNNRQDRVLVLDGLENDDWSTYCALNYPEATVYNLFSMLSPIQKRRSEDSQNADGFVPPANHRRISHASIAAPFPFPKGFFDAVVFRFPAANHPNAYRNAISECKRVLKPGGYLEMSILDMDLVNMGNRARRAVREVKVRMQTATPEVSLSPISDTIMKLLGRKGFENLNRCVVGVPVAGQVADSRSSSTDEYLSPPPDKIPNGAPTLKELLSAQSSESSPHYPVTKMVARVGRWWWSQCYENCVLGFQDESIWSDRQLLKECENRETGFRLVVCYAQKPVNARRRTVSV